MDGRSIYPTRMDIHNPTRFRPAAAAADRFVPDFSSTSAAAASADEDLTEDDIFSSLDFSSRRHNQLSSSPSLPAGRPRVPPSSSFAFSPPEASSFGILAALPEQDPHHIFNHKASASAPMASSASSASATSHSPSSISASRLIPSVPKPPTHLSERFLGKYPQSAPVNIPVLANLRRRGGGFLGDDHDEVEEEDEAEDEVLRPPHEIVARRSERVACSVLEGAGRTLKGRDLRRVRNAVWRQTGFLD
ncbi:hypothetical protein MLD38_003457 [Melastoma candidum]|uniref:Uncharacterized protein n=1 Tax=Melastoma candidum TaxID=119954 RepID=A0ACB9S3B3_9MYRT|nr:hypothetical protein MLD38_003457 [Melastoma candidum]